ncbi:MAG: DUF296 domain-containing protein [Clostridiales bacterium]|nr:DUF296 domain-containing protein [Clostridiales bacterium]
MKYRRFGDAIYIRVDKGEEIITKILEVCKAECIGSATFSGIGGLSEAQIQTFIPEKGEFETETVTGMLELVSINGNIVTDEDMNYFYHAHSLVSYKDGDRHIVCGGHTKSLTVLYTGEIELRPVTGGCIKRIYNPETGTGFWDL